MPVPENSVVWWPYTTAVPSGWSAIGGYVGRFAQGGDPTTFSTPANGGASTHNHTLASHVHAGNPHSHTLQTSGNSSPSTLLGRGVAGIAICSTGKFHSHISTAPYSTFSYGSSTASSGSVTVEPPYVKCVMIEPDDGAQDIPDSALVLADSATPPSGFDLANGGGGRPDLHDRFLLGCAAGVGNDGGDTGGTSSHTHDVTHGTLHAVTTPDHPPFFSGQGSSSPFRVLIGFGSGAINVLLTNHHSIPPMTHGAESVGATVTLTTDAVDHEPSHITLAPIINTSGGAATPVGVILGYTSDPVDLPLGWHPCDGTNGTPDCTDRQIKMVTSSPGATGGSDSHDHEWTHTHTHTGSHNHSPAVSYNGSMVKTGGAGPAARRTLSHTHTWLCSQTTPTLQDTTVVTSSDDSRQAHRSMVFIKKTHRPVFPGPEIRENRLTLVGGH